MRSSKLYYADSYLKNFKAQVLSSVPSGEDYFIELVETAFYPEGGGQPSDTGVIGTCNIKYVFEKDGRVVHIGDKELTPGQEYNAKLDWQKRYEHMQLHTAEHLVSGIVNKLYNADNVGFGIGETYVTIDYNVELSREDTNKIELLANEAVFLNIPVAIEYFEKAPQINYRSKKELSGELRLVTIEDYDICACAGTQLRQTGEIGLIKIISTQKYKSGSRLYMLCGYRALRDYSEKEANITAISTLLSSKPYESAEYVKRLFDERDALKFELIAAKHMLVDMKCAALEPGEKAVIFEENITADDMKRYVENLKENFGLVAVFSGNEEQGYRYMISSKSPDFQPLVKNMNATLSGKGGGKEVAGGHVSAKEAQIRDFLAGV